MSRRPKPPYGPCAICGRDAPLHRWAHGYGHTAYLCRHDCRKEQR